MLPHVVYLIYASHYADCAFVQILATYVSPLTVWNRDNSDESPVFVCLSDLDLLRSHVSFILDRQTSDLWVNGQCHSVFRVAQYVSCVNAETVS
jgi:hypothetical protein